MTKCDLAVKFIRQCQPRVIIYIKFVDLESPIAPAGFENHGTSGSEKEDFEGFDHIWTWRIS